MVAVIIDNFNKGLIMNVVNPVNGKPIPMIVLDEPFMLRCPQTDLYYRSVVSVYGRGPYTNGYKYIIKDTQSSSGPNRLTIKEFTVRNITTCCDMYKTLDEVIQLIASNDYEFTHIR